MNQSKIMITKMLFIVGLGLGTIGYSNAMDRNPVKLGNTQCLLGQKHWDVFLMSLNQPGHSNKIKINKAKPKSEFKPKAKANKLAQKSIIASKSKKPRQARNAEFFHRELNQQKNELVVTQNKVDQYQVEKIEWKYRDRLKKQLADEKKRERVKFFVRNSARK